MLTGSVSDSKQAFVAAAAAFVGTVDLVGERWDAAALGEWTVRDLVGHTHQGVLLLETYLARPADVIAVSSAAGYFQAVRALDANAIASSARKAGTALGRDPAEGVSKAVTRATALLEGRADNELLVTVVGGMRLGDYLATRTFELTVHTADLAVALDLEPDISQAAGEQALYVIADLAVADGLAGSLLRAATGRSRLPPGFCVL